MRFRPRPWSITRRLTVLYTVSAFGMLVVATAFLYWVLRKNLVQEDDQFLTNKIHVLRVILQKRPYDPGVLEEEVVWEGSALQFTRYYARVMDRRGRVLIETPGMAETLSPPVFPLPNDEQRGPLRGVKWRAGDGKSYVLMSGWAEGSSTGGERRVLQVALDDSYEDALIADYGRKLLIVLTLGLLFSAGAGIFVARQGMRPLGQITKAAHRITFSHLHDRIGSVCWPTELASLAGAFDEMLGRLEDSFTRLSQFSADLAHELRTPINNLVGEAEVALSEARAPEEYCQILESSLEEYSRLSRLIDSLLFLARAENAEITISKESLDIRREIRAVCEFYEALAEEQEIKITYQGDGTVHADPMFFRRAISNLLSNALRYTPRGGQVRVRGRQSDDQVAEVNVSDTGVGIEPEDLPRVFDRFYRTDRARSQHPQSTGLGLAIVKSIMDLHGGTVAIQSEASKGTTVTLRFPTLTSASPAS